MDRGSSLGNLSGPQKQQALSSLAQALRLQSAQASSNVAQNSTPAEGEAPPITPQVLRYLLECYKQQKQRSMNGNVTPTNHGANPSTALSQQQQALLLNLLRQYGSSVQSSSSHHHAFPNNMTGSQAYYPQFGNSGSSSYVGTSQDTMMTNHPTISQTEPKGSYNSIPCFIPKENTYEDHNTPQGSRPLHGFVPCGGNHPVQPGHSNVTGHLGHSNVMGHIMGRGGNQTYPIHTMSRNNMNLGVRGSPNSHPFYPDQQPASVPMLNPSGYNAEYYSNPREYQRSHPESGYSPKKLEELRHLIQKFQQTGSGVHDKSPDTPHSSLFLDQVFQQSKKQLPASQQTACSPHNLSNFMRNLQQNSRGGSYSDNASSSFQRDRAAQFGYATTGGGRPPHLFQKPGPFKQHIVTPNHPSFNPVRSVPGYYDYHQSLIEPASQRVTSSYVPPVDLDPKHKNIQKLLHHPSGFNANAGVFVPGMDYMCSGSSFSNHHPSPTDQLPPHTSYHTTSVDQQRVLDTPASKSVADCQLS